MDKKSSQQIAHTIADTFEEEVDKLIHDIEEACNSELMDTKDKIKTKEENENYILGLMKAKDILFEITDGDEEDDEKEKTIETSNS